MNNNFFILRLISQTTKSVFVIALINILFESLFIGFNTNIGRIIFDSVNKVSFFTCCLVIVAINVGFMIPSLVSRWLNSYTNKLAYFAINRSFLEKVTDKVFEIRQHAVENPSFFDEYSRAITEISERPGEVVGVFQNILGGIIQFFIVTIIVSNLSLKYTIFFIIASVFNTIITVFINEKEYKLYEESTQYNRKLGYINRVIYQQEYGHLLRNNILFGGLLKKYTTNNINELRELTKKYQKKLYLLECANNILSVILYTIIPWTYAVYGLYNGIFTFGEVTVILSATSYISEITLKVFGSVVSIRKQSMFISNLRNVLDYKDVRKHGDVQELKEEHDLLAVRGGAFSYYTNTRKLVLCGINMTIHKGEKVALVGPNGAGKSTLAYILSGLYSLTEGNAYLGGINIDKCTLETIHDQIIMCNQDTFMLAFTIAENILQRPLTCLEDYDLVEDALKKVGMYDKISKFKNGVDSYCTREFEEDGVVFSGGEIQKLAIARVYVSKAEIVIMDEPTSALDAISEQEITDLLFDLLKDKTLIIISHRLSFMKLVDTIYYLEDGRIVEDGSHDDLIASKGRYYDLYRTQADRYVMV